MGRKKSKLSETTLARAFYHWNPINLPSYAKTRITKLDEMCVSVCVCIGWGWSPRSKTIKREIHPATYNLGCNNSSDMYLLWRLLRSPKIIARPPAQANCLLIFAGRAKWGKKTRARRGIQFRRERERDANRLRLQFCFRAWFSIRWTCFRWG